MKQLKLLLVLFSVLNLSAATTYAAKKKAKACTHCQKEASSDQHEAHGHDDHPKDIHEQKTPKEVDEKKPEEKKAQ